LIKSFEKNPKTVPKTPLKTLYKGRDNLFDKLIIRQKFLENLIKNLWKHTQNPLFIEAVYYPR